MPLAAPSMPAGQNLIAVLDDAVAAAEALFADARRAVAARVTVEGRPMARVFDREQRATHGLAWLATYVEAIRQLAAYAGRMIDTGNFGEIEDLVVRIGAGEIFGPNSRRHCHEPGRDPGAAATALGLAMAISAPSVAPGQNREADANRRQSQSSHCKCAALTEDLCAHVRPLLGWRGEIIDKRDSVEGDRRLLCRSGSIITEACGVAQPLRVTAPSGQPPRGCGLVIDH